MTRTGILIVAVVAVVAVGLGVYSYGYHVGYHCTAGPGEKCASDQFVKDWREFKALRTKASKPQLTRDEQVRMQGLLQVLNGDAPAYGKEMKWDEEKERFVTAPPPPTQSLAPTPPAAVPPKK